MSRPTAGPPLFAERLLGRILNRHNRPHIIGDFEEIYHDVRERRGRAAADLWYGLQILKSLPSFIRNAVFWSFVMFRNYLKVFGRDFVRHLGVSLINLGGLALGLGCCLLISLWVSDELSFDRFHAASGRLVRIETDESFSGTSRHGMVTPIPLAAAMEREIPEVEHATRFSRFGGLQLAIGETSFFEESVIAADPSFLKMFSFPLTAGNQEAALSAPLSVLITKRMAEKHFPGIDPLGLTVRAENAFDLTVTGVLADPPANSSLQFDWIVPFAFVESRLHRMPEGWQNAVGTYALLQPAASGEALADRITSLIQPHLPPNRNILYSPAPLTRIHLSSQTGYVYFYSLIGLLVLGIACINFMNLSTARAAERAREIGLRKVVGACRGNLVRQFYGESLLYVLSSLLFAVGMTILLLPAFNAVTGKQLAAAALAEPRMLAVIYGIVILTALVSGSYPAAFLSRLRPAGILRGERGGGLRRAAFRKALVFIQFSLSILLLIGTVTVLRQTRFLKTRDTGFDRDRLVLIPLRGDVAESYEALKTEFSRFAGIESVTAMSRRPSMIGDYADDADWEGKPAGQRLRVIFAAVDYNFAETVGLELASGRDFSPDRPSDRETGFLVNEEMARRMGRTDLPGTRLSLLGREGTIVGVVKNFNFQPLDRGIEPLVLLPAPNPNWLGNIVIRLRPGNVAAALDRIKDVWKRVLPDYPFEYGFVSDDYSRFYRREEQMGRLLQFFTGLALAIACLGLFGLASFVAEQRTREIGIRKVLGASISKIICQLSREIVFLAAGACLLAWPSAYLLTRTWLKGFAYRTEPGWPLYLLAGLGTVLVAFAAAGSRFLKAARTDPAQTLKYE
jgi:putative ABC transport system permease protein